LAVVLFVEFFAESFSFTGAERLDFLDDSVVEKFPRVFGEQEVQVVEMVVRYPRVSHSVW